MTALLPVLLVAAVLLLDPAGAQTDPPSSGDWTVSDDTLVENTTVVLRGNLTVASGGNLTLRNVTLQVLSGPLVGTHGITVEPGGRLTALDLDGDNGTQEDASTFMRSTPSYGYFFLVKAGSTITLRNSIVSAAGAAPNSLGVLVRCDDATFEGVLFVDCDSYGLMLEGSNGPRVEGCSFYYCGYGLMLQDAQNVSMEGNIFSRNAQSGVWMDNTTSTMMSECLSFENDRDGLVVTDSRDLDLVDCLFYGNLRGVTLSGVLNVGFLDCQAFSNQFEGLRLLRGSTNVTLDGLTIYDAGRSGIEGDGVTNLSIRSSTIRSCTYFGLRLLNGSVGLEVLDTRFEGNAYDGIHVERAVNIDIDHVQIVRNRYNGIFITDSQNVSVRRSTIQGNGYDGLNCDNVRGLTVDTVESRENTYNGIYLQAGSSACAISRSQLVANSRSGLTVDSASDLLVDSCSIFDNRDFGIRVESGAQEVRGSGCMLWNNTSGGVRVEGSSDVRLTAFSFTGSVAKACLTVRNGGDVWLVNSTLSGSVDLRNGANATIVDPASETFTTQVSNGSWLDLAYWVDVLVVWPDDRPVSGALVNSTSVDGERRVSAQTRADGTTGIIPVTVRTWQGAGPVDRNPTEFRATFGTEWAGESLRVTANTLVTIVLQDSEPPVAVAHDIWVELGSNAVLDGSGSTDNAMVVSWSWRFEDGIGTVVLVGPKVNWTFKALGVFPGVLNVTDQVGLTNATSFTVHVTDTTPPSVAVGGDMQVDQHTIVVLDATGTLDNDLTLKATGTFTWTVVNEENGTTVAIIDGPLEAWTFHDMGNFIVSLRVTDQSGNAGEATFNVTVRDIEPPEVDGGPDRMLDQGETVVLQPRDVRDNDPDFDPAGTTRWRIKGPGTDLNLTGYTVEWTPSTMGSYQVYLYVRDASGNVGSDTVALTVRDVTPPEPDGGGDRTVEMGETVFLDASGCRDNDPAFPTGAAFNWTVRGPDLDMASSGRNVSVKMPWVGAYTVTLTVRDAAGNVGVDTFIITSEDPWVPTYGTFFPLPEFLNDHGRIDVLLSITDRGTGVNVDLVEMRTRAPHEGPWTEWALVEVGTDTHLVSASIPVDLPQGDSALQFRCWDLAGNGPVLSPEHTIRVNSRPVVVVLSPTNGADYTTLDEIWLDASPTYDPDTEDLLNFRWSSNVDGLLGSAAKVRARQLSVGDHRISLLVIDGVEGHDVLVYVNITVAPEPSTVTGGDEFPWYLWVVIALLVVGTVLVVMKALTGRGPPPPTEQEAEWEETPEVGDQSPGPVPRAAQRNSKRLSGFQTIEDGVA